MNRQHVVSLNTREAANQRAAHTIVSLIDELRKHEACSVEILCDNHDFNGHKDSAVICSGDWTDYIEQRYEGDTLVDALLLAVTHMREVRATYKKT